MKTEDINFKLLDKERNLYELADLYHQQRVPVADYLDLLQDPKGGELSYSEGKLSGSREYEIKDDVVYFKEDNTQSEEWQKLNTQFLNYHRSLSVYTLLNSSPIVNYLSYKTGLGALKNAKVLDVGGGTGHTLTSFFQFPESLEYFLVDPNLRLLHDQFIRIYPKLSHLKMRHLIAQGEFLPFKDNTFDFLINISAIDHMDDYKKFISEAFRVLKPGGKVLISSHLDIQAAVEDQTKTSSKIFSYSFWERLSRYLYYRKYAVGSDDHTLHLEDEKPIEKAIRDSGFQILDQEVFKRYFYIVGVKS